MCTVPHRKIPFSHKLRIDAFIQDRLMSCVNANFFYWWISAIILGGDRE